MNKYRLYDFLEIYFFCNIEDFEEDYGFSLEEKDKKIFSRKRKEKKNLDGILSGGEVILRGEMVFVVFENLKFIYFKRSLVIEFLN